MKLVIHAPNVHAGGGKSLLVPLLRQAKKKAVVIAVLDERLMMPEDISSDIEIIYVKSTLLNRLAAEFKLFRLAKKTDIVLCFGNLPPLFNLTAKVILYIQNRYLVDDTGLNGFPIKIRIRILMERIWLRIFKGHAHEIIVQTASMQSLTQLKLGRDVDVVAFFNYETVANHKKSAEKRDFKKRYDFLYIATGEPHKNHFNLIEAWKILARDNICPSLCLTLQADRHSDLVDYIEQASSEYGLKIDNIRIEQQQDPLSLYESSKALIYPSTMESFGLPLIEAKSIGLPIIASELDYVRDIVDPDETFDPQSPHSIARAIKRFLGISDKKTNVVNPDEFISKLIDNFTT